MRMFATEVGTGSGGVPGCVFFQPAGITDLKHVFTDCLQARDANLESVRRVARSAACCFKCLEPGHVKRYCEEKVGCMSCGETHATIYHGRDPDWFGRQPGEWAE